MSEATEFIKQLWEMHYEVNGKPPEQMKVSLEIIHEYMNEYYDPYYLKYYPMNPNFDHVMYKNCLLIPLEYDPS